MNKKLPNLIQMEPFFLICLVQEVRNAFPWNESTLNKLDELLILLRQSNNPAKHCELARQNLLRLAKWLQTPMKPEPQIRVEFLTLKNQSPEMPVQINLELISSNQLKEELKQYLTHSGWSRILSLMDKDPIQAYLEARKIKRQPWFKSLNPCTPKKLQNPVWARKSTVFLLQQDLILRLSYFEGWMAQFQTRKKKLAQRILEAAA